MKEISRCAELRGRNSGYFPLSQKEAERIRRFLSFREDCDATSVLDPCAGGGAAMATITSGAKTVNLRNRTRFLSRRRGPFGPRPCHSGQLL